MKTKVVSPEDVELDAYEQELEANFEQLQSYPLEVEQDTLKLLQEAAKNFISTKKDARVAVRVHSADLESIKSQAKAKGLRYQTYIASLIHQAAIGRIKV